MVGEPEVAGGCAISDIIASRCKILSKINDCV